VATFKEITAADIKTSRSTLNQLVDIIQEDVLGPATRRKYQVFVTGGVGPGVTSSLFQTVYDQDFTLQTANPLFDMTVGLFYTGSTVTSASTGIDSTGKLLFPSNSLMMREKVDVYKQFAQMLLGDANKAFYSPFQEVDAATAVTNQTGRINNALFIPIKRLFTRDQIKRETLAIRLYSTASTNLGAANIATVSVSGSGIFTDFGSSVNQRTTYGSEVGDIVDSSNVSRNVGNVFYDAGVIVLDMAKVFDANQRITGSINAMSLQSGIIPAGQTVISASFIPDFLTSGSIDNIIDHIAGTRFQSGSLTAMTFQNNTFINSTLVFCRATADEFNYSSNPSFKDSNDRIRVIDQGQEGNQRAFSMPTTIGLYDANSNLLAVAKLSRPIEKNDEKDLTVRVRLDF
jgi:hypothetical protein